MTISVVFAALKTISISFLLFFAGTSDPFKNRIKLSSCTAHVHAIVWAFKINLGEIRNYGVKSSKMSLCGSKHEILVFFSTFKIIRNGFPLFFAGTSDPFKNKTELSSFSAHVHVIVWAFKINLGEIRNYGMKRSKIALGGSKHDDIGVFFNTQNHSHGLSYSFPGTSDPFKYKIELRSFFAHVHVIVWAFKINLGKIRNYGMKSSFYAIFLYC